MRVINEVGHAWGVRMGTRLQYDLCSHVYSHYPSTAKGSLLPPLWLKYHCRSPEKTIANAEAVHLLFVVVVENRLLLYQQRTHTYRRESPIHNTYTYTYMHIYICMYIHGYKSGNECNYECVDKNKRMHTEYINISFSQYIHTAIYTNIYIHVNKNININMNMNMNRYEYKYNYRYKYKSKSKNK